MLWRRLAWRGPALLWAERAIAAAGREVTGKPQQFHIRSWSTVLRIPTDRGVVYFKAIWPPQRHEVPVSDLLWHWAPRHVGVVLAADPKRGFLLVDDAGERLRAVFAHGRDLTRWHSVLPLYAELQLATAPHAEGLLEVGAPDRRAATLAGQYERLLEQHALLRVGRRGAMTAAHERKLRALVPTVREWCAEIAGTVPDTIQHDDLHDGQVFLKDGHYRILDWGDACVSHPFYSLTVALRSIAYTFKLKDDSPELRRLVDLYLEPFTAIATRHHLRETYEVARKLGRVCRALTWASLVPHLPAAKRRQERDDVPGWLRLFLDAAAS
jgi:phosphotransferase family enzyme